MTLDETYFKINLMDWDIKLEEGRMAVNLGSKIGTIDCASWPLANEEGK